MEKSLTIHGVEYRIIKRTTADLFDAQGQANTARMMRKNSCVAVYILQRPAGKKYYSCSEFRKDGMPVFTRAIACS